MAGIPRDLSDAVSQAREATEAALKDGLRRIQVELVLPELKIMPVAEEFVPLFAESGAALRVFFPDAGAAALARRDWGELGFSLSDVGSGRTPMLNKIKPEDEIFLFIEASAVEVTQVEELCNQAGDRPIVFLNPKLEDVATIGIGYAGRQLRDRFLSTIESVYYLKPLEGLTIRRAYPNPWEVWLDPETDDDDYQLAATSTQKPVGEVLDELLGQTTNKEGEPLKPQPNFLGQLQGFLKALSR